MNPYQYPEYRNPWAPSIAQVLLHGGDIEAQRAATVAGANARATEIRGQAAASAAAGIGAAVGAIPQTIDRQQLAALDRQRVGGQVADEQRAREARSALADVMKTTPKLSEDGVSVWDVPAITRTMADKGFGPEAGAASAHLNEINNAFRQTRQAQLAVVQRGAQAVAAAGNDPALAHHFLDQVEANQIYPPETIKGYRDFIDAEPGNTAKLTAYLMGPQKFENATPGSAARNPVTGAIVPGSQVPNKPVPINGQLVNPDTGARVGDPVPKQVSPPEAQHVTFRLDGKDVEGSFVPSPTGGRYMYQGEDVTGRAVAIPPASIQIHTADARALAAGGEVDASRPDPATANKIDPKLGITPNAVYQGAISFALEGKLPAMGRMSGPIGKAQQSAVQNKAAAIAAAAGVDIPTVRAEYRANAGTLAKLLPQAQATANFANTATDNLDLALGQSAEIGRSGSKLANRYLQWAQGELTPAAGLTKFETYVYTAAREYAKVTGGGALSAAGLTDSAQKEAAKLLSTAQAPESFQAAAEAMKADMANVISNQTKGLARVSSTIANFFAAANGVAPAAASTPAATTPPPAGPAATGVTVSSPAGKPYTFPTQADADAFVAKAKAAGLWK